MTREEKIALLKHAVGENQLDAYRMIRMFLDSDPKTLGYKDHEDMVRKVIAKSDKECARIMLPLDRGDFDK